MSLFKVGDRVTITNSKTVFVVVSVGKRRKMVDGQLQYQYSVRRDATDNPRKFTVSECFMQAA